VPVTQKSGISSDVSESLAHLKKSLHTTSKIIKRGEVLQRVIESNALFESDFSHFRRGTLTTHLVSFKNAIKLVMALPGKNAKEARADFAHVLLQFIAGDSQLKVDIDKNAESSNLLNILAREAIRIESSEAVPSDRQLGLLISNAAAAPAGEKLGACLLAISPPLTVPRLPGWSLA
jgi:hypothetical protein